MTHENTYLNATLGDSRLVNFNAPSTWQYVLVVQKGVVLTKGEKSVKMSE